MLKNILNLEGAQQLSKAEQKSINGGSDPAEVPCGISYKKMSAAQCVNNQYYSSYNASTGVCTLERFC